jgi:hypothetical protein
MTRTAGTTIELSLVVAAVVRWVMRAAIAGRVMNLSSSKLTTGATTVQGAPHRERLAEEAREPTLAWLAADPPDRAPARD